MTVTAEPAVQNSWGRMIRPVRGDTWDRWTSPARRRLTAAARLAVATDVTS